MLVKQYIKKKVSIPFVLFLAFLLTIHMVFLVKLVSNNKALSPVPVLELTRENVKLLAKPSYLHSYLKSSIPVPQQTVFSSVEECLGKPPDLPVIAPAPVLDVKNMNYSLTPLSPLRPSYPFQPDNREVAIARPMVTILTPFYNTGPLIHDAARCVFGQSMQLFQWIIVNDGSTKQEALDGLAMYRNLDPRILVIDLPKNKGLPGARNEGIARATGKYILLLDPDDMIESTFVEKAVWFLETHPNFAMAGAWSLGFDYKEYVWMNGFQQGDRNLRENTITVATVMRTDVLKSIGMFDENLVGGMEDWDLWLRMADNGHWGYTLEEFHFWYRVSPPGKWSAISNATLFKNYVDERKVKYSNAFTRGVPKVERPMYERYEDIPLITDMEQTPVTVFNNQLKKCKPRIVAILPSMEVGGADQFNFNFFQGLALDGWEITVVGTKKAENKWVPEFMRITSDIHILPNFLEGNSFPNYLVYLAKSRQPDVMFISNSELGYLAIPYLKHHVPWVPLVDYVHSETPKWKSGGYARYSAAHSALIDRSIFASDHLRNWVIKRGHIAEKCATVRVGVDADKYVFNAEDREDIRSMLGVPEEKIMIAYVARLAGEKQPLLFAKVMKNLADRGLDFLAVSLGDGEMMNELNNTIAKYGIQDKVLLWGAVPNKEISKWVSASDIFFLPSKVEGISLAIYEAMSMGRTAVSARVGGQAELVVDGTGFLVKPETDTEEKEYTEILERLIREPALVRQLGENSRKRIVEGFSSTITLDKMKQEFTIAKKWCESTAMSATQGSTPEMNAILREMMALATEYFRNEHEGVAVWRDMLKLQEEHNNLVSKLTEQPVYPVRPPSPIPNKTPEEVLQSIDFKSLRVVEDVLEEKNVDRNMEIVLRVNEAPFFRRNPFTAQSDFDANKWMVQRNHDVEEWNDKIPYSFRQQEYVATLENAFLSPGDSATIFDHERVFLLKKHSRTMFTPPIGETPTCELVKFKKLVSLVQYNHDFAHFVTEMLPRLTLVWDKVRKDPEIHVLVPDFEWARDFMEGVLQLPSEQVVYYRFGPGWSPCHVFFAEELLLPTPVPTGNPSQEIMHATRRLLVPQPLEEPQRDIVLYCSRSHSVGRVVANEEELLVKMREALPNTEIVVVHEGLPIKDTIEYAKRAKAVIGSHGSTLHPMIYMEEGVVVELLHSIPWLQWWAAANSLGHDYWMVPIEGANHDSEQIVVPIDLAIATITQALGVDTSASVSTNN